MKKFYSIVSLLLATSMVFATDIVTTITGVNSTQIVSGPLHLESIEVINNHPSASMVVKLFDSPSTNVVWTRGEYQDRVTYTTNLVRSITTYNGITQQTTNVVVYTDPRTVAEDTARPYTAIKSFTVAAGASATWEPIGGVYLSFGLIATNSATNVTINTTFSNIR